MSISQHSRIVFFGTDELGAIVLEKLVQSEYRPELIITNPDEPVGRKQLLAPPPVKSAAMAYGIPVWQPAALDEEVRNKIQDLSPELFIVAAYGKLLPKELLSIPAKGTLNVHPSLLPEYRGPSPIQSAIADGRESTGVTIMVIDEKMDHGPIVAAQEFLISTVKFKHGLGKPTTPELKQVLAVLGAELLIECIPKWLEQQIVPVPQDDSLATYTTLISKEDGKITWKDPAEEIERRVRAFTPWPGTFTFFTDKNGSQQRVKVLRASVLLQGKEGPFGEPGKTFLGTNSTIAVQTGRDYLIIEELQFEGKNPVSTKDFLLGNSDFVGTVLT